MMAATACQLGGAWARTPLEAYDLRKSQYTCKALTTGQLVRGALNHDPREQLHKTVAKAELAMHQKLIALPDTHTQADLFPQKRRAMQSGCDHAKLVW